jgi:rhodanese-related sulfurtransferase
MTPLRLGLTIMAGILILGVLLFRFWPLRYDVSLNDSAVIASEVTGVNPVQFWSEVREADSGSMIIDIRDQGAYKKGHIKGSVNIPVEQILNRKSTRRMRGERVLIYGSGEQEAHQIALMLRMRGIDAEPVNGGYSHLQKAKLESGYAPVLFYSEEKAAFNYQSLFKAFEISESEPIEFKVPLPRPEGC